MAPDRPDSSEADGGVGAAGSLASRVFTFCEAFTMKEGDNANDERYDPLGDDIVIEEEEIPMIPKTEPSDDKSSNQSDDDLTSLSWLHQQNLLKGLEITEHPVKIIKKEESINNNIICEDSLDISENTNSVSSLDESYSPESNGKTGQVMHYDDIVVIGKYPKSGHEGVKGLNGATSSIQMKHHNNNNSHNVINNNNTNANFNLPVPNRNKHPTHIPYDPHLHRNSKPPYSFSCLIFMAIEDSPLKALPVKEIYAWILEHFPYFRNAPTGWKNSVRHNLSLNKCFRKVEKSPNLGKGSLWMVDAQYRPNLIQALARSPFPPPTSSNIAASEKNARKTANSRLPDPVLFPYLSRRLASSNMNENAETEFDSDVDAAAAAMLSFKHGPVILNSNKDRSRKHRDSNKMIPIITRSSTEDHTYSLVTAVRLERTFPEAIVADVDEQRKIAEGADALLNLAGVNTTLRDPLAPDDEDDEEEEEEEEEEPRQRLTMFGRSHDRYVPGSDPLEIRPEKQRRTAGSTGGNGSNNRRKRPWQTAWNEHNRYIKQVRG